MDETTQHTFIASTDGLANSINLKANRLYQLLLNIDTNTLDTEGEYKEYFINHHLGRRLFFSLQNSAHIIYNAVKKSGKPVNEITFIDYGAGLGTLFMLAGMMGFKKMAYNDYFAAWHQPAKALCKALQIKIDEYVAGGIDDVVQHAATCDTLYDIIASRNVIEHIYNLQVFYNCICKHNSKAIVYSTTTANYHNPAMRYYHIYLHTKWEKASYRKQRREEIKKIRPSINAEDLEKLVTLTRGKGQKDFTDTIHDFFAGRQIKKEENLRSNTCDCITGVWNEHLLTKKEYKELINGAGFKMEYTPGYWDTHYKSSAMNIIAKIFNKIISLLGNKGILLSPFVNVIAHN